MILLVDNLPGPLPIWESKLFKVLPQLEYLLVPDYRTGSILAIEHDVFRVLKQTIRIMTQSL